VRRENVIKAGRATLSFYCGSCNRSWEQTEEASADRSSKHPRTDQPER